LYSEPPSLKERNPEQSHITKELGTNYYTTNIQANHTWENPERTFTTTTEIVIPHPSQKMKLTDQTLHQKQNPLKTKGNNEQNQAQKTKPTNKSITHQLLSNHYVKFPHYEKPTQPAAHYIAKGLVSPYYRHQQLNALALLHLRHNNLRLYPLTWQQQLQLQQQQYNHLFRAHRLEPLPLPSLQQIKEYMTDFKQLCEGLETLAEEDHLEEVHQEVEVQDRSPPPLPKAQYLWLHPEI